MVANMHTQTRAHQTNKHTLSGLQGCSEVSDIQCDPSAVCCSGKQNLANLKGPILLMPFPHYKHDLYWY